ncbi:MAG: hypothetical protein ACI9KE_003442 [Polyangiales bacterium]
MPQSALELRIGFEVGLYDRADVASWVDHAILAAATPCDVLLELTTLCHRTSTEIASLLDQLQPSIVGDTFILHAKAVAMMFRDKRLSAVAALDRLPQVSCGQTPAEDEVYNLYERMDLATQGIAGSVSEVEQEITEFLEQVLSEYGVISRGET